MFNTGRIVRWREDGLLDTFERPTNYVNIQVSISRHFTLPC